MNALPYILIAIAFVGVIAFVLWKRRKPLTIEQRVKAIKDKQRMPSGMTVLREKGTNLTALEVTAIEAGFLACIDRGQALGYTFPNRLSHFTVAILGGSEKHNGAYCYSIPTPPEYKGSVYDHDGVLWIAGQYLEQQDVIVLPEHFGQDLAELKEVSDNECQHQMLRYCNPAEYKRTAVHSPQTPHPLF